MLNPPIVWLTGQPCSGKTTIAKLLLKQLPGAFHIDGDDLRAVQPEGFDFRGRIRNVDRAQDIALYLHNQGKQVVVSLVSPSRSQRDWLKEKANVLEVHLHYDEELEVRGREHFHVADYEEPIGDYLSFDTTHTTEEEVLNAVLSIHRKMAATP